MHLPSGTLLQGGRYKIIEKIGQGGFGIVYKALHIGLQRDICIKEFFYGDFCERAENSSNITVVSKTIDKINLVESFRKKFIKEAQRLATFQSPSIVNVMDTFEENNTAYYVMEHIDGGSLENFIESSGALSESKTIEIILPILDALNALHSKGLLHLDIKPANIMLRKDLTPVLIDFGISKYIEFADGHTTTAPFGISKGYAPLEQYGGNISDFTKATDIYSLCATMYKMLTGNTPPEPLQIMAKGLTSPKNLKPEISESLNNFIVKGFSIKAIDRPQSVSQMRSELDNKENPKQESIKEDTTYSHTVYTGNRVEKNEPKTQLRNSGQQIKEELVKSSNFPPHPPSVTFTPKPITVPTQEMFSKPFSFEGRIRRLELNLSMIIYIVFALIMNLIVESGGFMGIFYLVYIPMLWFNIAQCVKRCHDIGNSGWYLFIPLYGFWLLFADSEPGYNEYGRNPKGNYTPLGK